MSGKTTEENILPFSYAVAQPILRHPQRHHNHWEEPNRKWEIYEKGSERSRQRYDISYYKIMSALLPISKHIKNTPLRESSLCRDEGFRIYLKRELEQNMGSVKARGVIYTLQQLSKEQKRKGVITISTGTFAGILCYYGNKFKIPVTVVLPTSTADKNVSMCRDLLATVIVHGINMIQAHDKAVDIAMKEGLFYLDGNDHPDMIVGQATLIIEIFGQQKWKLEEGDEELLIDAVILPTAVDSCALTMAIALAIKQWQSKIQVFEVLSEVPDPLVQGIRTKTLSLEELNVTPKLYEWHVGPACLAKRYFNCSITVSDAEIRRATRLLQTEDIVDSNAAIGLAAIQSGKLNVLKGKSVVLPLFGRMDSSEELMMNRPESSLESHAGSSRLFQ